MYYTDDPVADFERYDAKREDWRLSRPLCDYCDNHIQEDHYFDINGDIVCPDCLDNYFRKVID